MSNTEHFVYIYFKQDDAFFSFPFVYTVHNLFEAKNVVEVVYSTVSFKAPVIVAIGFIIKR